MLLHFGAVDWECTVWVNGKKVGEHTGGYDPFTFDITDALKPERNEIVVAVTDPTDTGTQPHGKQVLKPHGILYTAVTGIWQTVWLEPVPVRHIESLRIVPDVDRGVIDVTVHGIQVVASFTANVDRGIPNVKFMPFTIPAYESQCATANQPLQKLRARPAKQYQSECQGEIVVADPSASLRLGGRIAGWRRGKRCSHQLLRHAEDRGQERRGGHQSAVAQ